MQPPALSSEPSSESRAPVNTLLALLAELWRYKFVIPAVALLVAGATTFWTVRQPKVYEAVATLEYDPDPAQPMGSSVEDTSSSSYNYWNTQEFYETQNLILRSRSIAEQVVKRLRLHEEPSFVGAEQVGKVSVADAAALLMPAIRVEQIRDTRVVQIKVTDYSPERAQMVANTVVDVYLAKSLEDRLGTSSRALEWLGAQMENLKRDVEGAELALYKFREDHHSLSASLEERQKIIAGQLERYSQSLTEIHARRVQTDARLTVLNELLAAEHDPSAVRANGIAEDEAVMSLRSKYRDAIDEISRLSFTYGEAHPQVKAAIAARDLVLAQLKAQIASIVRGIEVELQAYDRAEKGIRVALDEVNQEGLQLGLQEIEYTRLERQRRSKTDLYDLVMKRAAQTDLTRALRLANGRPIDSALLPRVPVSPRVRLLVALGVIVGALLGVLAALAIAYVDNKVRGPSDIEARHTTLLGVLPSINGSLSLSNYTRERRKRGRRLEHVERDLIVHLEPRSTTAECCRTIRTNITFQSADKPLRTLAVTSAMPKDGKTTVSISLATVLAQSGKKVLLVDTDMRKPRLHRAFKVPPGAGITSVLAGETPFNEALQTTDVPGLTLLQCGPLPPNPSELLHTRRFAELVETAQNAFDMVIFDSPPLGAVTDPAIISTQVDGTIVVVRSRSTTRAGLDAALRQLRSVSARILGVVLNGIDFSDSNYGNYYAYYRGYYEEDHPTELNEKRSVGTSV
jgi:succinoglycan biosynthesis transport protein ExoP